MQLFDSHCHFNDEKFDKDRDEIINKAHNENVKKITCAGYDVKSSIEAIKIAEKYDFIYATCGISPNDVHDFDKIDEIEKLLNNKKIVAVGEIGLDYYWNKDNKVLQKKAFIEQIKLANKYNYPIQIHTRDAAIDTISILKENSVINKGIFHCCPLNQELIKDAVKLGFYISFSGNITFKNAKSAPCIELVPMDKILIETDSPYLSPEPYRGKRNYSGYVVHVAQKISEVKKISVEEVAKQTYENACKIFKINT